MCVRLSLTIKGYLLTYLLTYMVCSGLTKQSNSWFYVNVCERFHRFGSAKVVRSLHARECKTFLHSVYLNTGAGND